MVHYNIGSSKIDVVLALLFNMLYVLLIIPNLQIKNRTNAGSTKNKHEPHEKSDYDMFIFSNNINYLSNDHLVATNFSTFY